MKNLYYAIATTEDTDGSELVLEWYYYEHDFGGVELVSDDTKEDYHFSMNGKQWINHIKKYYNNIEVIKL